MIREMKASDYDAMMKIYSKSLERGNVTFRTECLPYDEWDRTHIQECRFVYEKDDKVVGFAMLSPTSTRECYRGVVEVSVYVDDSCQNMGIGTALLTKLMEAAREAGYWTLYSSIFAVNTASVMLHEKCGFRIIGTREKIAKDRFGNWQDAITMEWRNDIV